MSVMNNLNEQIINLAKGGNVVASVNKDIEKYFISLRVLKEELSECPQDASKVLIHIGSQDSVAYFYNYARIMTDFKICKYVEGEDINLTENQVHTTSHNNFLNWLQQGSVRWRNLDVIIIEDLHYINHNHVIRDIIANLNCYKFRKPKIFGISSSCFDSHFGPKSVEAQVDNLMKSLSAKFVFGLRMSETIKELIIEYDLPVKDPFGGVIESNIQSVKQFISDYKLTQFEKGVKAMPQLKEKLYFILDSFSDIFDSMGMWCAKTSYIYFLEVIKRLKMCAVKNEKQCLLLSLVSSLLFKICKLCEEKFSDLSDMEAVLKFSPPKVLRVVEVVRKVCSPNFSVLILIKDDLKEKLLYHLFKVLQEHDNDFRHITFHFNDSTLLSFKRNGSNINKPPFQNESPSFNLVIQYDEILDFDIFLRSKSKSKDSGYFVQLVEKSRTDLFLENYAKFKSLEKVFLKYGLEQEVSESQVDLASAPEKSLRYYEESMVDCLSPPKGERSMNYANKAAYCLKNSTPVPGEASKLYKIKFDGKLGTENGLGILTQKEIPELPPFDFETKEGCVTIELCISHSDIVLTEEEMRKIQLFINCIHTSVLKNGNRPYFLTDIDNNPFFIVPTKSHNNSITIDWDLLDFIYEKKSKLDNFMFHSELYDDAVLAPSYQNYPYSQFFYVEDICTDLSLESLPLQSCYFKVENYFKKKYNVEIHDKSQSLLYVERTPTEFNFDSPRKQKTKRRVFQAKNMIIERKEILVPELCQIHALPASLWRQAVFLPLFLYSLNSYSLANELKTIVAQNPKLESPKRSDLFLSKGERTDLEICDEDSDDDFDDQKGLTLVRYISGKPNQVKSYDYFCSDSSDYSSDENNIESCNFLLNYEINLISENIAEAKGVEESLKTLGEKSTTTKEENHDLIQEFKECGEECKEINVQTENFIPFDQSIVVQKEEDLEKKRKLNSEELLTNSFQKQCSLGDVLNSNFQKDNPRMRLKNKFSSLFQKYPDFYKCEPSLKSLQTALSLGRANSFQIIGSSYLRYAVSMFIFSTPKRHGGKELFEQIISDHNLASLAQDKGITDKMMYKFNRFTNYSEKDVANSLKSLIGAYLINCGPNEASVIISWLGIKITEIHKSAQENLKISLLQKLTGSPRLEGMGKYNIPKTEETINYRFANKDCLFQALIHDSCFEDKESSDELQHLGQQILEYILVRYLYQFETSLEVLEDLKATIVQNWFYAFFVAKHGLYKYYIHFSPAMEDAIFKYVSQQESTGHLLAPEYYLTSDDESEEEEVVNILGGIFKSIAAAVYLNSGLSFLNVWNVFYELMQFELGEFTAKMKFSPVRQLVAICPGMTKFRIVKSLINGIQIAEVDIRGIGTFKGIGTNFRQAKLTAAKLAIERIKN